ncbi:MAG TPA: hypothetical protein IAB56_06975 [Candidatus Scybalousia intestinigallinarum]|nr:hypothetical protein [Candidatus Scybalousia intestinigallinarum]
MKILDDQMLLDTMNTETTIGIVLGSLVLIMIGIVAFFLLRSGLKTKKIGFSISGTILFVIVIFGTIGMIFGSQGGLDWYLTKSTISKKYTEIESDSSLRSRTYYYIKVDGFNDAISVTEEEYACYQDNDSVYALIVSNRVIETWNMDDYQYQGSHLK